MSKTIGILGGMGPLATVDFVHKIVVNTPVQSDQDHIPMIIYNNPKIPSRIDAFGLDGVTPLPHLIQTAKKLEEAGADFIMMPCHSAHYWLSQIQQSISIRIHSMIACTMEYIKEQMKVNKRKFLLIASETTLRSKLYDHAMQKAGLELILPNASEQDRITNVIRLIKSNHHEIPTAVVEFNDILSHYKSKKITTVIAGCTELPLLFDFDVDPHFEYIDPNLLYALKAIQLALN